MKAHSLRVSISVQYPLDKAFWVPVDVLLAEFDSEDLKQRDVIDVVPAFHEAWFEKTDQGNAFIPPVVQIVSGRTQFINGRHRTAVLMKHLPELPISFAFANPAVRKWVEALNLRPIDEAEFVELPDLPTLPSSGG